MPTPATHQTTPKRRTLTWLSLAAALTAACPALGVQDAPQNDPNREAEQEATPTLLGGPTVDAKGERATLVRRSFTGELERLERHPAEAALDLIDVPEDARPAIDQILAERRRVLDELVVDRLDLLVKLANGGTQDDRRQSMRALRDAMAPLVRKGELGERIRQLLPQDLAAEHQRLEREYVRAAVEERLRTLRQESDAMGSGRQDRGLRMRAYAIERLVGLGAEVKGAYERTLVQQGERLDRIIDQLNLTPEQEGNVRRIIQRSNENTLLGENPRKPTERERLAVFLEVAAELTPEQRRQLVRIARGEG